VGWKRQTNRSDVGGNLKQTARRTCNTPRRYAGKYEKPPRESHHRDIGDNEEPSTKRTKRRGKKGTLDKSRKLSLAKGLKILILSTTTKETAILADRDPPKALEEDKGCKPGLEQ